MYMYKLQSAYMYVCIRLRRETGRGVHWGPGSWFSHWYLTGNTLVHVLSKLEFARL